MRFVYATGSRPLEGYTIKRGIGVGGFGEVYFALSDAGKEVALKRIQRNLDVELRGVRQCLNLKHANLIALYDIRYDAEGQAWVVMEYVSGESLKEVLDRNPHGIPPQEVDEWFSGLAAGVGYLHDHGIVHRDLKPGNVFIDGDVIKIGDYGLSKYISCSRRSGQTESVGTFHYMAPEIGRGVYGKEIDIYALGIILFEMLTGRVPFDGESSQEIIMKHLTAEPDLTGLPERYRHVVCRALFKDPAKRFGTVAEMLACIVSATSANQAGAPPAAIPPIRRPNAPATAPHYIGDDADTDGMYFGPVKDVVPAEILPPPAYRAAASPPPEPIATAVSDGVRRGLDWWRTARLSTTVRVILLIAAVVVLIYNRSWLVPLSITLGCLYLVYFGIRHLALGSRQPPTSNATVPVAWQPASPAPAERGTRATGRRKWQDAACDVLRKKSYSDRLGELSGSLLMSAFVVAVLNLLMMIAAGKSLDKSVETWTFYAWFTLTSVVGAWLVLWIGKFWEGMEAEPFRRRFVLLIAGLVLGLAAFGFADFLEVRLTDDLVVRSWYPRAVSVNTFEPDGSLKLPAFLVYFALVMALPGWWTQVDPLRSSRLSLFSTAACVFCAWICHMFWPFPQPWGLLLVAAVSVAVQLSAPWLTTRERSALREQLQHS